jgi:hypothetical protein
MDFNVDEFFGNVPTMEQAAEEAARKEQDRKDNPSGNFQKDFQPFVGIMSVKNPVEIVRFLHDEPVLAYMHDVYDGSQNPPYRNALCFRKECDLCDEGHEPKWKCAWVILHQNHSYQSKKNGKVIQPQIKILMKGENFSGPFKERVKQLAMYKRTFSMQDMEMKQFGEGFGTKYSFTEIPDTEELKLPATLPRMYPEEAGKSVEEDRARAVEVFTSQDLSKKFLQQWLLNIASKEERAKLKAVIAAGEGSQPSGKSGKPNF